MSAKILTQKELQRLLHYNPETGVFTWKIGLGTVKSGSVAGGVDDKGYDRISIHGKAYKSHRLTWLYITGEFPADQIDHVNHIRNDNRFSNLRETSNAENHKNRAILKNNSSGVTGVSWYKPTGKWCVRINANGKIIYGGYFNCITAAALARKALEIKHGYHENHGS